MNYRCLLDLAAHWASARGLAALDLPVDPCPPEMSGDLTLNCFRLVKGLKAAPPQLVAEAVAFLGAHPDVVKAEGIKGFVNVTLQPVALYRDTVADEAAMLASVALPAAERRKILVEYSSPNTNKPQHLGHVRNNTLGAAICAILARLGHTVSPVNLVNDRGIHICKSMLSYQRSGTQDSPASRGLKGDHLIGEYYVKFEKLFKAQVQELKAADPSLADKVAAELFLKTEVGRSAQALLQAWERGDLEVRALWQQLNSWVLAGFAETYKRLSINFVKTYYESETYRAGKEIVRQGLEKGVFYKRDDGVVEINLEDLKLGRKVVLRGDGTTVYVTQDLGTTLWKYEDFRPDAMIWITADEQIYHFQVLLAILGKLGYPWVGQCRHLAYGMVHLPTGRMKSREGTVVDADELFDEMRDLAKAETVARLADQAPPADLDARSETIGLAALRFMLLKVNPKTTMTFDPAASIKFEGDTGPYLLYAYTRIASMQRKVADHELAADCDWALLVEAEERALAIQCAAYGGILRRCASDMDPSILAAYLLELAKGFSRFYKQHSVLQAPTPALRRARFELCRRVQAVLRDGLTTLTLGTVESM